MKALHQMCRVVLCAAAVGALAWGVESTAQAVIVTPGTNVLLSGTTVAERPELTGTVLADVDRPFSMTSINGSVYSGVLQDRVVRGTDGFLLFETRVKNVTNIEGDPVKLGQVRSPLLGVVIRNVFTGFGPYDVDVLNDSLGVTGPQGGGIDATTEFAGFAFGNYPNFQVGLPPGLDTHFFFVRVNAPSFNEGGHITVFNSTLQEFQTLPAFQPSVPEPASAGLLGASALAFFARRRRIA